ncbi:MBL fold metallo-hydrolase [Lignipirellula cremea]|uniref:Beta-lactamase hydrolase-like protein n=1 Tax=Lignipirellula cremea TaxID=2528010 RepID=A0A518E4E7_9BACT|nr:MBL fold metallo-hydrolase [Lignipirellula cremea]QDU98893.1 Beta-lactamase hydrolase-like protein [Lignipirellula cremea]QDU98950.1 Beta-lactamase hydrolase-like protein [Lignipirellula cremea]
MLLKYFYDQALAHASYLVGCQRAKVAVVVDPGRDIDPYLEMAQREGLQLIAVAETHIHADFVSGARELADRVGAKLYVSDEGPPEWKYLFADQYDHQLVKDGDTFMIGNIKFNVLHTPGHTPESISFLLTDEGGGADQPMGIFTGDFVFVGSIGRPDLLEEAAGLANTAEPGARDLFQSAERFRQLPDYLQVWPAHGAGSACGKGLGAVPSSTVGYEKLFNPALQFTDEEKFVRYILSDQPEAPRYFAVMKRVNKEGPEILGDQGLPESQPVHELAARLESATVIDLSPSDQFAKGHVPGVLNIPTGMLAGWAGWVVDYSQPVYLIADAGQLPEAIRVLRSIGLDDVRGYFDAAKVREAGLASESYPTAKPGELASRIESGEVKLLDVRSDEEWKSSRIAQAEHHFLGRLPGNVATIESSQPVVTQCQTGGRSAIAASILQAAGLYVINMTGGLGAWTAAGLSVDSSPASPTCDAGSRQCT